MNWVIIYRATWTEQVIKSGVMDAHWAMNNSWSTINRLNWLFAWIVSHRATNSDSDSQTPISENVYANT